MDTSERTGDPFCTICCTNLPISSCQHPTDPSLVQYFIVKLLKYRLLEPPHNLNSSEGVDGMTTKRILFCQECVHAVSTSFQLHSQVQKLTKELEDLREVIEDKLLSTLENVGENPKDVNFIIRQKVKQESSTILPNLPQLDMGFGIKEEPCDDEDYYVSLQQDESSFPFQVEEPDFATKARIKEPRVNISKATGEISGAVSSRRKNVQNLIKQLNVNNYRKPIQKKPVSLSQPKLVCPVCRRTFPTGTALSEHIKLLHKRKFECLVCGMSFGRLDYLTVHKNCHSNYPEEPERTSKVAQQSELEQAVSERRLSLRKILGRKPAETDTSSANSSDLERNNDDDDEDYVCPDPNDQDIAMGRGFPDASLILKNTKCPVCETMFTTFVKLVQHILSEHTQARPSFLCDVCNYPFWRTEYVEFHKKKVHENDRTLEDSEGLADTLSKWEARTCPVCYKLFEKPSMKSIHHRYVHVNDKTTYECNHCGKKFKRQDCLKKHTQAHEEGESGKIHKCSLCPKAFRRKNELIVHSRLHSGAKDFLCSLCGVEFRHEWSFRRHSILRHDLGHNKDHQCDTCGKVFKIKWHLVQHLKSKSHGGSGLGKRIRPRKKGLIVASSSSTSISKPASTSSTQEKPTTTTLISQPPQNPQDSWWQNS